MCHTLFDVNVLLEYLLEMTQSWCVLYLLKYFSTICKIIKNQEVQEVKKSKFNDWMLSVSFVNQTELVRLFTKI